MLPADMAGRYIYRLMSTGQPPENPVESSVDNPRKVWLNGAPADVLQIHFKGGERKSISAEDVEEEDEPLEPEDGSYWADLPPAERRRFYREDIKKVCYLSLPTFSGCQRPGCLDCVRAFKV